MDTLADRIKVLIGAGSANAFARKSGIGESSLRQYLAGGIPSATIAARIAHAGGVSLDWLVNGEEETDRATSIAQVARAEASTPTGDQIPPEFALVPRLDVEVSAGGGAVNHAEETSQMLAFRSDWLHRNGISPIHAKALTVLGDSMEPTLSSGDVILIDTKVSDVVQPGIYVIRVDDRLLVKRIQPIFGGALKLISENPVYSPEDIPADKADQLAVIGLVRWCGRLM